KAISDETLTKAQEAGVKVVEFSDEQLAKVKSIVYEKEWPVLEEMVGSEIVNALKEAAGRAGAEVWRAKLGMRPPPVVGGQTPPVQCINYPSSEQRSRSRWPGTKGLQCRTYLRSAALLKCA